MNGKTQFNIWYWIAAFPVLMVFQYVFTTAQQVAQISYSEFESHLQAGRIAEVQVSDQFVQRTFLRPQEGLRAAAAIDVAITGEIENAFLRDLPPWLFPLAISISVGFSCCGAWVRSQVAARCRSARARPRSTSRPTSRSPSTMSPAWTAPSLRS